MTALTVIDCSKYRFLDESPRWLFSQGRVSEAETIIRKMLTQNGKANIIPEQGFTLAQLEKALGSSSNPATTRQEHQEDGREVCCPTATDVQPDRKYGVTDLFKTPRLRYRTLNVAFNW